MWLGTRADGARRSVRIGATASLCAALLAVSGLSAQGTPAGSRIRNWATLGYTSNGFGYTIPSDTVDLVVSQVAAVDLQPSQTGNGSSGAAVVFAHTLSNLGNGADSFSVAAVSVQGWSIALYHDVNANGVLDAGDTVLTGPVALGSGATAALLARVSIPAAGSGGVTDTIAVTATSRFNGAVSATARDVLTVAATPVAFTFTKQVDRASAAAGDVLTYTLTYSASGTGSASGVQLADTVPGGSSYVAGSIQWNGVAQTDAADGDAGTLSAVGNGVVVVSLGTVAPGDAGSITFQARVSAGATTVSNRGNIMFAWSGGSDTTLSNVVQTAILTPALSLTKQLVSPAAPGVALVGQQVQYRLRYSNAAGAGSAQNVVLTDTIPAGLQYVSASVAPVVTGQVLTWTLGALAAGDTGRIDLVLDVAPTVRDTQRVVNTAYLQGQGTPVVSSAATQLALVGPPTAALGLDFTADVLEVGVGEAIPYSVVVRNPGTLAVSDIQIAVQPPLGGRYVPASAIGADSVSLSGGQLILYSAAALAPGASRTLRFVVILVSAPGTVAAARAVATGSVTGGLAGSPEAIAWVQVRRAWPMETRAAIGKIWVDANGDGVQQSGEPGLANVDVWTEDGLVATSDSTGKFSFTNLRPGRHAFRLDPRSLPDGYTTGSDDVQLVEASGWTTPHVDFRVLANGAQASAALQTSPAPQMPAVGARPESGRRNRKASRPQTTVQTWSVTFGAVRLRPPADSQGLPLSFERRLTGIHGTTARYELTVAQPREVPIDAVVAFSPQADSAIVYVDGALFSRYSWLDHWGIAIPFAHPGAQIRIVAWSSVRADSATLRIVTWPPHAGKNADARRYIGRTEAALHVSMRDTLAPMVATIEVPAAKGGTAAASVAAGPLPVPVPPLPPVPVPPMPAADGAAMIAHDTVVVAPARPRTGPDGQTTEQLAAVVQGPGVEIFSPGDGAVLTNDHAYIGVKGEPSEAVVLYDGVTRIDSARTRIDGVLDFIAVPLARGPHRLRVAVTNSWGHVRWDSIAVHVTGLPARFELSSDTVQLVGDGRSTVVVSARVLDGWGVPVVQPAYVTVSAKGATPLGADADASSVGLQLLSSATGRLAVALRPGRVIGPGQLELKSGDARATVALDVLPEVRGLTVAGSGMVGAGATPDAYGALTARGRIDSRTSFTVGVDSRRLNDGRNAFARSADPLEESQYPILGDGSAQQAHTASQSWFSGRLERGYDWAMFGDLATNDFANGLSLAQYRRSVTGVAAHLTTGAISWSAFGSLTAQSLRQLQIRGAGISGPYQIASDVVPGTDNVRVETRDHLNPERTVQSQAMIRFVDYQVDYADGVLLFKQPIPAMDPDGNPVFIVVTFEGATSGDQRLLAGARAALDVRRLLGPTTRLDSVRLGVTAVNADQAIDRYRLVGSDLRLLRVGAIDVAAEVAYAERGDSTGIASSAKASYTLFGGALTLGGSYMQVGREFINPSNLALRPGLTEATVRTGLRVGSTELRAEHAYEAFQVQGVDRRHSRVGVVQHIGTRLQVEGGVAKDQVSGAALPASDMTAADLRASWAATSRLRFWSEGRRHLSLAGPELAPELWGVGLTYQVLSGVSLEASERYVTRPDSQRQYSVSSIGLRADMGHGTQAWGSYQLTGGMSGAGNAAIIGLRNRLQVTPELAVNVLFERRQGVGNASVSDPVRALPFLQTEGDYWSAGAGIELLPKQAPYRLTARGEYKDGSLQSTRLATVSGDVALAASLALLTRQEFAQNALAGAPLARRLSSLWGVAFRPARTDRLNLLAKFQWTEDRNPVGGGVLVARGEERKLIAAGELIWTPLRALELSTRYAVRRTQAERMYADSTPQTLTAWADYLGGRINVNMSRWLSVRSDGRFLMERTTGATAWDASPALVLHPVNGLEIASGYRFGNLSDPDFSVRGGHGAFVTLSATISEKLIPTAAAFWRNRF